MSRSNEWWKPHFKTKKALKEKIRSIANDNPLDAPLGDVDRQNIMWVFSHFDYPEEKAGSGVKDIIVRKDSYGNRCFYLARKDGTEVDISWTRGLEPKSLKRQDFLSALRQEVRDQIFDFKKSQETKCAICGDEINGNLHVDHLIPFRDLVKDFFGGETHETIHEGDKNYIKDRSVAQRWSEYHEMFAVLQVTHAQCNLRKG